MCFKSGLGLRCCGVWIQNNYKECLQTSADECMQNVTTNPELLLLCFAQYVCATYSCVQTWMNVRPNRVETEELASTTLGDITAFVAMAMLATTVREVSTSITIYFKNFNVHKANFVDILNDNFDLVVQL